MLKMKLCLYLLLAIPLVANAMLRGYDEEPLEDYDLVSALIAMYKMRQDFSIPFITARLSTSRTSRNFFFTLDNLRQEIADIDPDELNDRHLVYNFVLGNSN
jgi:hypothetical protein